MKHNYTFKTICSIILLSFITCFSAQAAPPRLSPIEADIHYLDGRVEHVEHFQLPQGNLKCTARYLKYSTVDENDKAKEVKVEAENVDYLVCWHAMSPDVKYRFDKIMIRLMMPRKCDCRWAILMMEGKNCKVYRRADLYSINENGELTITYELSKGANLTNFIFEGDEYASFCVGGPNNWAIDARTVFPNDKKMIKDMKNNVYDEDDFQEILDTYKRPEPLRCR